MPRRNTAPPPPPPAASSPSVLTDLANQADRINEAKAEEACRRTEARLQEKSSAEHVESVNASLAHSVAQLRVKRRQRR